MAYKAKSKKNKITSELHPPEPDTLNQKFLQDNEESDAECRIFVGCHDGYSKFDGVLGSESIALEIEGNFEIIMPNGDREHIQGEKLSFCTCGQSKNKPFCDQTHQKVHNVVEDDTDVWDQMDDYERIQTLIAIKKSHQDFRLKDRKDLVAPDDYLKMREIGREIDQEMLENENG